MKPHKPLCLVLLLGIACRTREEPPAAQHGEAQPTASASEQRPLPVGLLVGSAYSSAGPARAPSARVRTSRERAAGDAIELLPAAPGDSPSRTTFEHLRGDSLYLPLDAM